MSYFSAVFAISIRPPTRVLWHRWWAVRSDIISYSTICANYAGFVQTTTESCKLRLPRCAVVVCFKPTRTSGTRPTPWSGPCVLVVCPEWTSQDTKVWWKWVWNNWCPHACWEAAWTGNEKRGMEKGVALAQTTGTSNSREINKKGEMQQSALACLECPPRTINGPALVCVCVCVCVCAAWCFVVSPLHHLFWD